MKVSVRYLAQLKQAAGVGAETVEVGSPCTPRECVGRLAEQHGGELRRLLLGGDGRLNPTVLVFVGDEQVMPDERVLLNDGDVVTVLLPVAGG
jgi:molybdopterin converting factor small subunit